MNTALCQGDFLLEIIILKSRQVNFFVVAFERKNMFLDRIVNQIGTLFQRLKIAGQKRNRELLNDDTADNLVP